MMSAMDSFLPRPEVVRAMGGDIDAYVNELRAEIERLRKDARAYANVQLSEENDVLIDAAAKLRSALQPFADEYAMLKRNGYLGSQLLLRKGDAWLGHCGIQEPILKAAFDALAAHGDANQHAPQTKSPAT